METFQSLTLFCIVLESDVKMNTKIPIIFSGLSTVHATTLVVVSWVLDPGVKEHKHIKL